MAGAASWQRVGWQADIRGGLIDDVSNEGEYTNPSHVQFVQDMEEAGLDVQHYQGRFYWEGPAVAVDDLQDALGATEVRCQWDHLGLGWIVYPRAYGHVRRIKEHEDAGPDES